jgi:hypothetical protein
MRLAQLASKLGPALGSLHEFVEGSCFGCEPRDQISAARRDEALVPLFEELRLGKHMCDGSLELLDGNVRTTE